MAKLSLRAILAALGIWTRAQQDVDSALVNSFIFFGKRSVVFFWCIFNILRCLSHETLSHWSATILTMTNHDSSFIWQDSGKHVIHDLYRVTSLDTRQWGSELSFQTLFSWDFVAALHFRTTNSKWKHCNQKIFHTYILQIGIISSVCQKNWLLTSNDACREAFFSFIHGSSFSMSGFLTCLCYLHAIHL